MTLSKAIATLLVSLLLHAAGSCAQVYAPSWDGGDGGSIDAGVADGK